MASMKIMSRRCCAFLLLYLGWAIAAPRADAAFDMFLKVDGIDGESTDDKHPKEIIITSFTQSLSNPSAVPGGSAGRAVFSGLTLSKPLDKSTPLLMQNAAAGITIKSAV